MVTSDAFIDVPVIDVSCEFVGAPGSVETLQPGDSIRLSSDKTQYIIRRVVNDATVVLRLERANIAWLQTLKRIDRIPLTGSPTEMAEQRRTIEKQLKLAKA